MDVKSAFLYGTIEEEVYVCQPLGFEDPWFPDKVYNIEKALYGLHQAPRAWYETLSTYLLENGFRKVTIDKTLFIKKDKGDILLVQVYVDDIIFGSTKKSLCVEFEQIMHKRFQMSSMRELTFFLGLQVKQKDDGIFISQDKYVADILKKFDFTTVKTTNTPIETNKALLKDEEAEDVDVHLYRSMIGSSMYLTASRPNIMFAVCACARFQVTLKVSHLHAVKMIFRYLKGQPKLGLWYPRDSPFDFEAFSDSDYAGASLDRKSTTGGCQFFGKRLISWQCKKQTIVANSTTEAEYVVAANCCGHVLWVQNQMLDCGFNFMNTKIYINNESTICIVKNPVFHFKTKHIEIRHHFIRDSYEKKLIQVIKIHTDYNVADLLTKAFDVSSGLTEPVTDEAHVSTPSHDPSQSGEDSMQLFELMNLCTSLQEKVLDLEKAKTAQAKEIASLKNRVKQLEKRRKLRTPGLKRLMKVGSTSMVESSNDVSLGDQEDASKQGRKINDLDADAEVTLVDETQEINDHNLMFDTDVLEEQKKEVAKKEVSTADPVTTVGEVVTTANVEATTANAPTTTIDELTLAQTLIEIKAAKPKVVTSAATTTTTTRPKARGVVVQEPSEFKTTSSPLQASQLTHAKDKDKAIMVESERPLKKKDQVAFDEEMARNLEAQMQAKLIEEERLARQKEEEANIALIKS
ncbi:putative ribonuclease H-like domain-containing protein [Tanacetum coccineum]